MRTFVAGLVCALGLGCATGRESLGDITLRPYEDPVAVPASFSVQQGRILSGGLDAVVDPDGCVRGQAASSVLQLCPQAEKADPSKPGAQVEHWSGVSGNFTTELSPDGTQLRADGFLRLGGIAEQRGRVGARAGTPTQLDTVPVQTTLRLGKGPQWDELRRHPVLLTLAAALSGVRGEPPQY